MNKIFRSRRSIALKLAISMVAALAMGWLLARWGHSSTNRLFGASNPSTWVSVNATTNPANLKEGFSSVVEPLLPMVVNISTSKTVKVPAYQSPFFEDPFFRQFFGDHFGEQQREQREHSLGSGVIVNPDGYILTNNHVVEGATDVRVTLNDKRSLNARIVGTDPRSDIAVLKIPATKLAAITLGNSAKMRVGDIVLAIGDPFGIGETVTMGIVSATERKGLGIEGPGGFEDFIQTDAAINPGNSGGALVNTHGELIGINAAIITGGGGGNQGIGFAIPINMGRSVMEQILKTGKVSRGYMGIGIQELTPDLAKSFGAGSSEGALISSVEPDGPGGKAGLQKGDIVTALNDQTISDYQDFRLRIAQMAPGTAVTLDVWRDGHKRKVTVTLAEYPETKTAQATTEPTVNASATKGLQVETLTSDVARQLNLRPNTRGVVVIAVDPDSPSADTGLQRGDVIQEVSHKEVDNLEQFQAAIREAGNKPLLLLVNRGGNTQYVVLSSK